MLFVYGSRKPWAWADALAARAGNQVLALETGHWVMSEQPQRFNQAVDAWLGRA
jgi:pimeloyl-ACP methyl ester carboxylesterase